MAEYYEQGVTPPTPAVAAYSRYSRLAVDGVLAQGNSLAAAKGLILAGIESVEDVSALTRAFRERGIQRRGEDAALIWGTVAGARGRDRTAVTTTLDEREEKTLIATARAGGQDRSAALPPAKIDAAVGTFPDLDFSTEHGQAQRGVIDKLGTGGRIGLAIGVAGSGKTTLLKPLVHAWRDDGRTVHGLALAWRQSDDWLKPVSWAAPAPSRHSSQRLSGDGSRSTRNPWSCWTKLDCSAPASSMTSSPCKSAPDSSS